MFYYELGWGNKRGEDHKLARISVMPMTNESVLYLVLSLNKFYIFTTAPVHVAYAGYGCPWNQYQCNKHFKYMKCRRVTVTPGLSDWDEHALGVEEIYPNNSYEYQWIKKPKMCIKY